MARQAGWSTPKNRIEHVPFGVVQGAKGTKISSREGDSMTLKSLLEQAVEETKKAVHAAKSVFVRLVYLDINLHELIEILGLIVPNKSLRINTTLE